MFSFLKTVTYAGFQEKWGSTSFANRIDPSTSAPASAPGATGNTILDLQEFAEKEEEHIIFHKRK